MTDQEKIKGHPYVKKVNEPPSGTSNTITDPINEEALHEPSLMNFDEQTPTTEQNPPVVESGRESTQKINVSGGTYHEQILLKVDMNAIESLVKTYVVIEIDSSNKDLEKNETHGDDLKTPKEHPKDFLEKKSKTEVKNDAFQHSIDNTIADFSSPVSAIRSEELLQKENLPDLILPKNNIEVQNELQESTNAISTISSRKSIDNIIAEISTPVIVMKMKSVIPLKSTTMNVKSMILGFNQFFLKQKWIQRTGSTQCLSQTPAEMMSLKSYKNKMSNVAGDLNDTPFDVEYVEDIAQQVSGSLDCGVFMTGYEEFLSDQMQIPSSNLDAEYLRKRYATLLWNYGVKKAKKIYSSDHDDPPRVRPFYVPPTDESNILAIE
ncbi:hypothetical protein FXO37_22902 [Capsicum annuum]|nr:hypothetical protein FXO37_22902 [Capsicum annuum]